MSRDCANQVFSFAQSPICVKYILPNFPGIVYFTNPEFLRLMKWVFSLVLRTTRSRNQLCSDPLCFANARLFHSLRDFGIFGRGQPSGNKLPALLLFGKHRPANWIRFVHLVFFDFGGGGVCSKARNASSNFTPRKLIGVSLGNFVLRFNFIGTNSLSPPRNSWESFLHKEIRLPAQLVPSIHLPIH